MTVEEFIRKASYEGGIFEGFQYGLAPENDIIVRSEEEDDIYRAVFKMYRAYIQFKDAETELMELIPGTWIEH